MKKTNQSEHGVVSPKLLNLPKKKGGPVLHSPLRGRILERLGERSARLELSVETGDGFFVGYDFQLLRMEANDHN